MAMFPRIDSPCPYKAQLDEVMDGQFCRMCKRDVHDLTAMDEAARRAFLAGCETEVCVSYRIPALRPALAAAALAASVAALPAAAQSSDPAPVEAADIDAAYEDLDVIIVGGITDPKNTAKAEDAADAEIPELPVVVEEPGPAPRAVSVPARS
ncbi:hypothetical protein ACFQ1E_17830 [Sphingomonas canadensis]|uniref:DUF1289 domain-containing protein n=1 Tax=Sphingomonas canadensis TaxID=1219257 RepID=A0ABW3HBY4_9SPHN|nr:hypothetical protein [Sphingomonas canadensis]MCW3837998.1 hypothetical protein [Sphingomonas canadensis]